MQLNSRNDNAINKLPSYSPYNRTHVACFYHALKLKCGQDPSKPHTMPSWVPQGFWQVHIYRELLQPNTRLPVYWELYKLYASPSQTAHKILTGLVWQGRIHNSWESRISSHRILKSVRGLSYGKVEGNNLGEAFTVKPQQLAVTSNCCIQNFCSSSKWLTLKTLLKRLYNIWTQLESARDAKCYMLNMLHCVQSPSRKIGGISTSAISQRANLIIYPWFLWWNGFHRA